jgi:Domain of unknown function (DUF4258)
MIEVIREKILKNQYEYSQHALNQSLLRKITVKEVKETILQGEIIENYPDDKYGASCLIFGLTKAKRPLHIQCSYPTRPLIKIITLYQPDFQRWIDYKIRKNINE